MLRIVTKKSIFPKKNTLYKWDKLKSINSNEKGIKSHIDYEIPITNPHI